MKRTESRPGESRKEPRPQRILVVRLSAIGDCLHAVPVVEELRRQLPKATIGWLVQEGGSRLLAGLPSVDRFHQFERKALSPGRGGAGLAGLWRLRKELRSMNYDVALDLQGLTKSGLLAWLSGARRTVGFGGADSREFNRFLIKERYRVAEDVVHVVDRNLALLPALGLEIPARPQWHLPIDEFAGSSLAAFIDSLPASSGLALISPGTSWPTKVWPQRHFAEVARMLAQRGLQVVVAWAGPEEESMARQIAARAPAVLAPETSLRELAVLTSRCRVVISNDSGPLHLAVALGVPAVGVYGPTDPARNGPYGWQDPSWPSAAITLADTQPRRLADDPVGGGRLLPCQFCWKTTCQRGDRACLEELPAVRVAERALELAGLL